MQITGPSGRQYEVKWQAYGWSYARPLIYIKKRINVLGLFCIPWRKLMCDLNPRQGRYSTVGYIQAQNMLYGELKSWFQQSVNDYEERLKSFGEDL